MAAYVKRHPLLRISFSKACRRHGPNPAGRAIA